MPENAIGIELDPLQGAEDPGMPLIHRLLANPRLRARYVSHVRTIADEWLRWEKLGPQITTIAKMISHDVKIDYRKLAGFEAFEGGLAKGYTEPGRFGPRKRIGLETFIVERGKFLREHETLKKPRPQIVSVEIDAAGKIVVISAQDPAPSGVWLHYSVVKRLDVPTSPPFQEIRLTREKDGQYVGYLPALPGGTTIRYYAEAFSEEHGTADLSPRRTELGAKVYEVPGTTPSSGGGAK